MAQISYGNDCTEIINSKLQKLKDRVEEFDTRYDRRKHAKLWMNLSIFGLLLVCYSQRRRVSLIWEASLLLKNISTKVGSKMNIFNRAFQKLGITLFKFDVPDVYDCTVDKLILLSRSFHFFGPNPNYLVQIYLVGVI